MRSSRRATPTKSSHWQSKKTTAEIAEVVNTKRTEVVEEVMQKRKGDRMAISDEVGENAKEYAIFDVEMGDSGVLAFGEDLHTLRLTSKLVDLRVANANPIFALQKACSIR